MTYNPQNAVEQVPLQAGIMAQGIIIAVNDGKIVDFIDEKAKDKWNNTDQPCIEVVAECQHQGESFRDTRLFVYKNDEQGRTVYGKQSNLGKYAAYYKKLPSTGDQVQLKTNAEGYFRLVID